MQHATSLSPALEDYLEVMLDLQEKEHIIRVTDIAQQLKVAKPTVSQTIAKLKKLGMVLQESYGAISLTQEGFAYAGRVQCRHRLLRDFLVDILGVELGVAEKEACMMEHVLSRETMSKFNAFMVGKGVESVPPYTECVKALDEEKQN